jgi:hypothetical protein
VVLCDFGVKNVQDWTCLVHSKPNLSGNCQFCFQNPLTSAIYVLSIPYLVIDFSYMLPRSARITMPSATPRSQSKALSMETGKLQSMRAASNPVTLAFGLFSTRTSTIQSTSQNKACGGNSVGQLGLDGKKAHHLQPNKSYL